MLPPPRMISPSKENPVKKESQERRRPLAQLTLGACRLSPYRRDRSHFKWQRKKSDLRYTPLGAKTEIKFKVKLSAKPGNEANKENDHLLVEQCAQNLSFLKIQEEKSARKSQIL